MNTTSLTQNMKKSFTMIVCAVALLAVAGCSSLEKRSQKLQLGMTNAAAVNLLDADYTTVAARVDADGTDVSVLKYPEKNKQDLFLYFRQNKLVQWGDASVLNAMPPAPK